MSFVDARDLPPGHVTRADVCIVGSGPSGLTVATELTGHGPSVVILEAGGRTYSAASQAFYRGEVTGRRYYDLDVTRLRMFGGSGAHWEGFSRPLDPWDFVHREWVSGSGWPIGMGDLLPWYRRAQELCELGPWEYDATVWADKAGLAPYPVSPSVHPTVLRMSPPTRFGERYGERLAQQPDVQVHLNAPAVLVERASVGGRISAIVSAQEDGTVRRYEAERFVLALGGLETPRLLLASGGVGNESDNVGRFFMEHPHVATGYCTGTTAEAMPFFMDMQEAEGAQVRPLLMLPEEVQAAESLLNCGVLLVDPPVRTRAAEGPVALQQPVASLLTDLQGMRVDDTVMLHAIAEQRPNRNSRVVLGRRQDALGQPRIELHWQLTDQDLRSIRRTSELLAADLGAHGFGRTVLSWPYPGHSIIGGHHHMGTTRMHADPQQGVVDENCRVHGSENLYITGASVFTTGGFSNPTLTLVALAARLGNHLKESG